jgi:gamma-soluble NSF attachment protein
MAIELGNGKDAVPLLKKAANFFREDGKADKGAEVLCKAAQAMGEADVDAALECFADAVEILADDDKDFKAGPTYKLAISFALQHEQNKMAVDLLKRQIVAAGKLEHMHQVHKCQLSIVIVHLHSDDLAAAQQFQSEQLATDATGYPGSTDAELASRILAAYEARDQEALSAATAEQHITFLDNQVARVAKKLSVSEVEL